METKMIKTIRIMGLPTQAYVSIFMDNANRVKFSTLVNIKSLPIKEGGTVTRNITVKEHVTFGEDDVFFVSQKLIGNKLVNNKVRRGLGYFLTLWRLFSGSTAVPGFLLSSVEEGQLLLQAQIIRVLQNRIRNFPLVRDLTSFMEIDPLRLIQERVGYFNYPNSTQQDSLFLVRQFDLLQQILFIPKEYTKIPLDDYLARWPKPLKKLFWESVGDAKMVNLILIHQLLKRLKADNPGNFARIAKAVERGHYVTSMSAVKQMLSIPQWLWKRIGSPNTIVSHICHHEISAGSAATMLADTASDYHQLCKDAYQSGKRKKARALAILNECRKTLKSRKGLKNVHDTIPIYNRRMVTLFRRVVKIEPWFKPFRTDAHNTVNSPTTMNELLNAGSDLDNCIAGYASAAKKKDTFLALIHNNKEERYVGAIEVKPNGQMVQFVSGGNRDYDLPDKEDIIISLRANSKLSGDIYLGSTLPFPRVIE